MREEGSVSGRESKRENSGKTRKEGKEGERGRERGREGRKEKKEGESGVGWNGMREDICSTIFTMLSYLLLDNLSRCNGMHSS